MRRFCGAIILIALMAATVGTLAGCNSSAQFIELAFKDAGYADIVADSSKMRAELEEGGEYTELSFSGTTAGLPAALDFKELKQRLRVYYDGEEAVVYESKKVKKVLVIFAVVGAERDTPVTVSGKIVYGTQIQRGQLNGISVLVNGNKVGSTNLKGEFKAPNIFGSATLTFSSDKYFFMEYPIDTQSNDLSVMCYNNAPVRFIFSFRDTNFNIPEGLCIVAPDGLKITPQFVDEIVPDAFDSFKYFKGYFVAMLPFSITDATLLCDGYRVEVIESHYREPAEEYFNVTALIAFDPASGLSQGDKYSFSGKVHELTGSNNKGYIGLEIRVNGVLMAVVDQTQNYDVHQLFGATEICFSREGYLISDNADRDGGAFYETLIVHATGFAEGYRIWVKPKT